MILIRRGSRRGSPTSRVLHESQGRSARVGTRSKLGKPTQYIEPYWFGHAEQKKTGLWLKGLPKLEPTKLIDISHYPPKQRQRLHWLPPSKDRWKLRSLTYLGVAEEMADQWSN